MKFIYSFTFVFVLCLGVLTTGIAGEQIKGIPGNVIVTPRIIPSAAGLPKLDERTLAGEQAGGQKIMEEEAYPVPEEEYRRLASIPPPAYDGKGILTIDAGAKLNPLSPRGVSSVTGVRLGVNFEGNLQGGSLPGDPMVAAGLHDVISTANSTVRIRSKTGTLLLTTTALGFVNATYGGFDPKVVYDVLANRYIMVWDDKNDVGVSKYYVAVSQTDSAMGAWFVYQYDMTLDGSTQTTNWADFPGLGYDNNCIYLTANMFSKTTVFQYVKTRVLDKNAIYLGLGSGYVDIIDVPGPGNHFTLKPAQSLSPTDTGYLAIHPFAGGGTLQMYRITGGPGLPVLTNIGNLTVSSYGFPPNGKQEGCDSTDIVANDARTHDPVWRDGYFYLATEAGISINGNAVCAMKYYKVKTLPLSLITDEVYAADGEFYLYPAVTVDKWGTAYFAFSKTSASEYASAAYTVKRRSDTNIEPSSIMKAGFTSYLCTISGPRWGDYEAISIDPAVTSDTMSSAWLDGNFVKGPTAWGSWIGKLSLNFHQIQGYVLSDCDSNSTTSGDRTPVSNVPVTLSLDSAILATTMTDSAGNYTFGNLDDGLYDVTITIPNNAFGLSAVAGSGGTSQVVVNDTDLQITLSNGAVASQYSINNNFLIVTPHMVPVASTLSPDAYSVGEPGFTMTIHGSSFEPCAVVRIDDSARATTFVNDSTLNASILASDIASLGTHTITVFNPTPAGGVSNGLLFTVHVPAPVFSGQPLMLSFGDDYVGSPVVDTITVTNTGTADLTISGVASDNPIFTVVPTSGTVPRQTSTPFVVTFIPPAVGGVGGNIIFTHNASSSPDSIPVTGAGIDSSMFLTGTPNDWAYAVDAKLKHKSYPRKTDKVFFDFHMTAPANPSLTSSLVLTFNAVIKQLGLYTGPASSDTIPYTTAVSDPKGKMRTYTFAGLSSHFGFDARGVLGTGKKATLSFIWYDATKANKQKGKAGDSLSTIVNNTPGLPEPNLINVGEELFPKGHNQPTSYFNDLNPLIIGIPSGSKGANSVKLKKFSDVLKSLIVTRGNIVHTGPPSCIIWSSQLSSLSPTKQNDALFAQILALKLNIAASAAGKFPVGFGELTYSDSTDPGSPFNGHLIKNALGPLDSLISCDPNTIMDTGKAMRFLRAVNGSFSDPSNQRDTFSFFIKTQLKGVKHIQQVSFLQKSPGVTPVFVPTPIIGNSDIPTGYALYQNYPNPFNPTTIIQFALPEQSIVTLKVYNVLGQEVSTLLNNEVTDMGTQEVEFDASRLSSGVYFYRITVHAIVGDEDNPANGTGTLRYSSTKKMLLMR